MALSRYTITMIHIKKSRSLVKPFIVSIVGNNGEKLNSAPLKTKQAAFKNILAVAKQFPLNTEDTQLFLVMDGKTKKYLNLNTGTISNY